jgi:hypothetical protein
MRGKKIFNEVLRQGGVERDLRRGRNNTLICKRNECLLARYYYYGHFREKSYEETISLLVAEFYLSPITIVNIVLENTTYLQMLKDKAKALSYFNFRWEHLKW